MVDPPPPVPPPQAPTWGANRGATSIVLFSTAIICLIVPGLGLYHAGLSKSLDAVNAIATKVIALAAVVIQWFFLGWTLCFSGAMRKSAECVCRAVPSVARCRRPPVARA